MAKQRGREAILQVAKPTMRAGQRVGETYVNVGTLNAKTFTIESGSADVTTAEGGAATVWTETLDTTKRVTVSGDGILGDTEAEGLLKTIADTVTQSDKFIIKFPAFGDYEGTFRIDSLEFGGETESGVTFSVSLSSENEVTHTPPPLEINGLSDRTVGRNTNTLLGTATTNSDAPITWAIDPTVSGVTIDAQGRLRYQSPNAAQSQSITVRATEAGGHRRTVTKTILISVP